MLKRLRPAIHLASDLERGARIDREPSNVGAGTVLPVVADSCGNLLGSIEEKTK